MKIATMFLVRFARSLSTRRALNRRGRRVATLALTVLTLPVAGNAQTIGPGAAATGDADADALITEIERVHTQVVAARRQLRSDRLDPEVLLDNIGFEAADILDWVAAETRWVPYEGVLRGSRGVLMDRSGSSLDRAVLLADLLDRAGLEVRLANTQLPAAAAAQAVAAELSRRSTSDRVPMFASDEEVDGYRQSVRAATEELSAGIGLLDTPVAGERDPIASVADHWWVQARERGQWIDYDPLFPAEAAARPAAARTIDWTGIPDGMRHSVTVRVVIERLENGALIEEVPLEYALAMGTDETPSSMTVDFLEWVSPEFADLAAETTDSRVAAQLTTAWLPLIRVDGETTFGDWFTSRGRLEAPTAYAGNEALARGVAALAGLGFGAEGEAASEPPSESVLTAAWLEYVTEGPGIAARTERREILDLIGGSRDGVAAIDGSTLSNDAAVVDRGLAFLGTTDIFVQGASAHADAFAFAFLNNWVELRPALIALVYMDSGIEDDRIDPSLAAPVTEPLDLLAMMIARDRWHATTDTFIGRPQIWSRHHFFDPALESTGSSSAIDIVMNDIDVLPVSNVDPRLVRLEQGIFDTLIEHELNAVPNGLNTWNRFARRKSDGATWTVVRPGEEVAVRAPELPAADRARIEAALARGDTVVLASEVRQRGSTPFADWWKISPRGLALGMGYRGWGTDSSEEMGVTQPSLSTLKSLREARRVENKLNEIRETARAARLAGKINPYAHLSVYAETQPVIRALANTLPHITKLGG